MVLLLPGDPGFDLVLATALPPNWREHAAKDGEQCAFLASAGSGILRPATHAEVTDYLWGGEYDERINEIADHDLDAYL